MEDERRQLHRAIEKEHRYLMAEKAKMAIGKRLAASDPQSIYNIGLLSQIVKIWAIWKIWKISSILVKYPLEDRFFMGKTNKEYSFCTLHRPH